MVQIYVNSEMVKPKAIHIYNSSAQLWEEDSIGYVRVNGKWISLMEYRKWIYENGVEFVPIVRGFHDTGTFLKGIDHIKLANRSSLVMYRNTLTCEDKIDLTKYKKILYNVYVYSNKVFIYLYVARNLMDEVGNSIVSENMHGTQLGRGNHTLELDVSDVKGYYHIMYSIGASTESDIYGIWLE